MAHETPDGLPQRVKPLSAEIAQVKEQALEALNAEIKAAWRLDQEEPEVTPTTMQLAVRNLSFAAGLLAQIPQLGEFLKRTNQFIDLNSNPLSLFRPLEILFDLDTIPTAGHFVLQSAHAIDEETRAYSIETEVLYVHRHYSMPRLATPEYVQQLWDKNTERRSISEIASLTRVDLITRIGKALAKLK